MENVNIQNRQDFHMNNGSCSNNNDYKSNRTLQSSKSKERIEFSIEKERSIKRRKSSNSASARSTETSNRNTISMLEENKESEAISIKSDRKINKVIPLLPLPPPPCIYIPKLLEEQMDKMRNNSSKHEMLMPRKRDRDSEEEEARIENCICSCCKEHHQKLGDVTEYRRKIEELEKELRIVKDERKLFAEAITMLIGGRQELEKYVSIKESQIRNKSEHEDKEINTNYQDIRVFKDNENVIDSNLQAEIETLKQCIKLSTKDPS